MSFFRKLTQLKGKLALAFIGVSVVPLVVVLIVSGINIGIESERLLREDIDRTRASIDSMIREHSERLLLAAQVHAEDPDLKQAIAAGDRDAAAQAMDPLYDLFRRTSRFAVFELGDANGDVLYRAHDPDKFGDSKGELPSIAAALSGKTAAGLEFGASGLALRAFAPIDEGGRVVGTLQAGMDGGFIADIERSLGMTLAIYNSEGAVAQTAEALGETEGEAAPAALDAAMLARLQANGAVTDMAGDVATTYVALHDPTGTRTIGWISFAKDVGGVASLSLNFVRSTSVVMAIAAASALAVSAYMIFLITRPVDALVMRIRRISEGDLTAAVAGKRRSDEIGLLSDGVERMAQQLRELIRRIQGTAGDILGTSATLADASESTRASATEFADASRRFAEGAASQSRGMEDSSRAMEEMAAGVQRIAESSSVVSSLATDASNVVGAGVELIRDAEAHVAAVGGTVHASADTIRRLNERMAHIDETVRLISDISTQVDLLSLNASIEAARAGEHGRGFAVVAGEIKKLAEQTKRNAEKIADFMEQVHADSAEAAGSMRGSVAEADRSLAAMKKAGAAFEAIRTSVVHVTAQIVEISAVTQQMSAGTEQVSASFVEMVGMAQGIASQAVAAEARAAAQHRVVEDLASSSERLSALARSLRSHVGAFKLEDRD